MQFPTFWRCLVAVALFPVCLASAAPLLEKPNFIFILADDMGYGDIGPFGSDKNRTPNLDRMAQGGDEADQFLRGAAFARRRGRRF